MSENESIEQTEETTEKVEAVEVDWEAEAAKWKSLSRQNEAKAKQNLEKAKAFDELQEQSKTELQKALEAKEAAEKAKAVLELENLRMKVASEKGVSPEFLHGDDEESMREYADKLLAWKNANTTKANQASRNSGKQGEPIEGMKQLSRDSLKSMTAADILAAYRSGQLDQITGKE